MFDIDADGIAKIEQREGRKLVAYQDIRGIWTIGLGHTAAAGLPFPVPGLTITEAECDEILHRDLAPLIAEINQIVRVPISQNEGNALASLGFNIGGGGLRGSAVIHLLNAGDVNGAADAFLHWETPAALKGRRESERLQFLSGGMASRAAAPPAAVDGGTAWLQGALNSLGASPALVVDGVYGPALRAAVARYQRAHGLTIDGLAGPQTNAAIRAALTQGAKR